MDGLVYTYWTILFYLAGAAQITLHIARKFWIVGSR
jgi:hypothetical protein